MSTETPPPRFNAPPKPPAAKPASASHGEINHHHHHKHKHPKGKPGVNLNVTSMVDILFNLLVYFIVTVNFSSDEGGLKAKLPGRAIDAQTTASSDSPDTGEKHEVKVASTADGYGFTLLMDGRQLSDFQALSLKLEGMNSKRNPGRGTMDPTKDTIVIHPGRKVRWQHVVNAFNQAVRAGYSKISFAQPND